MQKRGAVPALTRDRLRGPALLVGVALVVVAVDQASKTWALHALADDTRHLFWTLQLNLSFNSGVAFGLGTGMTPLVIVAAVVVLGFVIGTGRMLAHPLHAVAMGLIVGGAVSNLLDRLVRSHGGAVIDWIDLQWWPVFNVADAALSCGVVLLVIANLVRPHDPPLTDVPPGDVPPGDVPA